MKKMLSGFIILSIVSGICIGFPLIPSAEGAGKIEDAGRISAGYEYTAALKEDGTVWTWGDNSNWQLGDGTKEKRYTPVQVKGLTNVAAISAGWAHTIALKKDGTVWSWGGNFFGEVGDGTIEEKDFPVQAMGLTNVVALSSGDSHTMALKKDGTVWTWGANFQGQLGDGTNEKRLTPVQVKGLTNIVAISAADSYSAALEEDGTVWVWGDNSAGQLGDGKATIGGNNIPLQASNSKDVAAISAGNMHVLALKKDGTVWSWGGNAYGQLGDGTKGTWKTPVQVKGLTNIAAISAGWAHTIALKKDGTVWSWGGNEYGQLGDGTTENRSTPVQVKGLTNVVEISAGHFHSVALKEDGSLWVWGFNLSGQLGDGTTENRLVPVQLQINLGKSSKSSSSKTPSDALGASTGLPTAPETKTVTAIPIKSKVYVDGSEKSFEAYTINGNNYFKLRDIAMVLNGTKKQFEVGYSKEKNAIYMTSQTPYTPVGGEMTLSGATDNRQGIPMPPSSILTERKSL